MIECYYLFYLMTDIFIDTIITVWHIAMRTDIDSINIIVWIHHRFYNYSVFGSE